MLAFDTATPAVTVALADDGDVLAETCAVDPRRHGELLAAGIDAVLREAGAAPADLTQVAVGVGPGPFTGLRVGVVTARTLGAALGVPVLGVCTLDVLAHGSGLTGEFLVVTDARRKEVYWARYRDALRIEGPHVDRPDAVGYTGPAIGYGATLYPHAFPDARPPVHPSAAAICSYLTGGGGTLEPLPLYLRRPDTAEPRARKRVS